MLEDPHAGCRELRFGDALTLAPAGEVALEDYARVVLRGRHAELLRPLPVPAGYDSGPIAGVHVCDPTRPEPASAAADVEAFARELAVSAGASDGLGWS